MEICPHNKFGIHFIQNTIQLRQIMTEANNKNLEDLSSTKIKETEDIILVEEATLNNILEL